LNNARSSDSLPHANTGPGLLIGAFHCEAVMLSPKGLDCERYQGPRRLLRQLSMAGLGGGQAVKAVRCCAAKRDAALQRPRKTKETARGGGLFRGVNAFSP
jgi:hypothetical protein